VEKCRLQHLVAIGHCAHMKDSDAAAAAPESTKSRWPQRMFCLPKNVIDYFPYFEVKNSKVRGNTKINVMFKFKFIDFLKL